MVRPRHIPFRLHMIHEHMHFLLYIFRKRGLIILDFWSCNPPPPKKKKKKKKKKKTTTTRSKQTK